MAVLSSLSPVAPLAYASGSAGTSEPLPQDSRKASNRTAVNLFLAVCWMLSLTGLSAPGRSAPLTLGSLDPIAIAKLITRLVAFAFLGHVLMHANDNRTTSLLRRLTPLALFTAWAAVSVFWSPMPTVTFGHASELVVMLMLAGAAGLLTLDEEVYSRI